MEKVQKISRIEICHFRPKEDHKSIFEQQIPKEEKKAKNQKKQ